MYYKGESLIQKGNHIAARIIPVHAVDRPKRTLKECFKHVPVTPEDAKQLKKVVCEAHQKYDSKREDKWK